VAWLAFGQSHSPFTPIVSLGGAPLLTFAVALTGTSLSAALLAWWPVAGGSPLVRRVGGWWPGRRVRARWRAGVVTGVWLVVAVGVPVSAYAVPRTTGGLAGNADDQRVRFALVQGNVPRIGLNFLGQREAVAKNHVNMTLELARQVRQGLRPRPDVVLWPENSTDIDPFQTRSLREAITAASRAVGAPILVGAVANGPTPDTTLNEGVVWNPSTGPDMGPGGIYVKRHLVPFGEYVPFRGVLTKVFTELNMASNDIRGHTVGVLRIGPAQIGDVICFEVAYDGLVTQTVRDGARVLVVQTNNADYNHTWQPQQQLAIEQLRAVEFGRPVLVPSTSGISALIAPDGTIVAQTKQFTPALLEAEVGLRTKLTLAARVGAWPEWILGGIGCAVWLLAGVAALRRRPGGGGGGGGDGDGVVASGGEPALGHTEGAVLDAVSVADGG
jgi:apolipoprotein N-acyltransferase